MQKFLSQIEQVLVIDKSEKDMLTLTRVLKSSYINQAKILHVANLNDAILILENSPFDLIFLELNLFDSEGIDTLSRIHIFVPDIPIIVMSNVVDPEFEMTILQEGAQDYVIKENLEKVNFSRIIHYAIARNKLIHELETERKQLTDLIHYIKDQNDKAQNIAVHESILNEKLLEENKRLNKKIDAYNLFRDSTQVMIQNEKMSSLGTFAAGTAHELINPMMGILNYVQYALKYVEKENKCYPYLQDAEKEIMRCNEIITNLLSFSRMEKDNNESYTEEKFSQIVHRVTTLLNYRLVKEKVTIHTEFPSDECAIKMCTNKIQQVVMNLIINAMDAMNAMPKKEIRITWQRNSREAIIRISDLGSGIDPVKISKIFDPFFTTKPVGKGTGLGLPIVRSIILEHGGDIHCESKLNEGTTFIISLPL